MITTSETDESKDMSNRRRMTSESQEIAPINLRILTGASHASNRGAIDWSVGCGLVAYGSNNLVVVVDPVSLQHVQVLDKHKSTVSHICWTKSPTTKHPADRLTLASADATGHIISKC